MERAEGKTQFFFDGRRNTEVLKKTVTRVGRRSSSLILQPAFDRPKRMGASFSTLHVLYAFM
jgi:hypothetical protein